MTDSRTAVHRQAPPPPPRAKLNSPASPTHCAVMDPERLHDSVQQRAVVIGTQQPQVTSCSSRQGAQDQQGAGPRLNVCMSKPMAIHWQELRQDRCAWVASRTNTEGHNTGTRQGPNLGLGHSQHDVCHQQTRDQASTTPPPPSGAPPSPPPPRQTVLHLGHCLLGVVAYWPEPPGQQYHPAAPPPSPAARGACALELCPDARCREITHRAAPWPPAAW
jgi:hypothetical protein